MYIIWRQIGDDDDSELGCFTVWPQNRSHASEAVWAKVVFRNIWRVFVAGLQSRIALDFTGVARTASDPMSVRSEAGAKNCVKRASLWNASDRCVWWLVNNTSDQSATEQAPGPHSRSGRGEPRATKLICDGERQDDRLLIELCSGERTPDWMKRGAAHTSIIKAGFWCCQHFSHRHLLPQKTHNRRRAKELQLLIA